MSNHSYFTGAGSTMHQQQQQQLSLMQQQQLRLSQLHQQQQQHSQNLVAVGVAATAISIPRTVLASQHLPLQQQHHQQQPYITSQLGSIGMSDAAQSLASPPYDSNKNIGNSNISYFNNNAKPTATTTTAAAAAAATATTLMATSTSTAANWDTTGLLTSQQHTTVISPNNNVSAHTTNIITKTEESPMALSIGPDGSLVTTVPRWNSTFDLDTTSPLPVISTNRQQQQQQQQQQAAKSSVNNNAMLRAIPGFTQQQQHQGHGHSSMIVRPPQRQILAQQLNHQGPLMQESSNQLLKSTQQQTFPQQQQQQQQQDLFANDYLFDAPSPVPTMSPLDLSIAVVPAQQHQHQHPQPQQFNSSPSPLHIPEYVQQQSCSPDMPIKTSPVENPLIWAPWSEPTAHTEEQAVYSTPALTHTSFDENSRDEVEFTGIKHLKVFTSSKKDDDGEFRKGQQFYLNIHLTEEDQERYRYLRIPNENIVLPCRADPNGRITLNGSNKRSAEVMSMPTSAQEEDVLSMKLTTYLEPEHRPVLPCGRCKDKTPEILRFHPGVNGKPMIDENGMVQLRNGQIKLIASAWCASTSHHRGPGTKFSFEIELTSMMGGNPNHVGPLVIYHGRSDEVEIYASHGRDKGSRSMSKHAEKTSKSQSPSLHESGSAAGGGPPSPAKTSSPPGSPQNHYSNNTNGYDTGPVKKRRDEHHPPPMTPPPLDGDVTPSVRQPPMIKSLAPQKGPICQENHVIIIGQNFVRGMTPMFGRDHAKVIDINPFYIECTTPRYPRPETVRLWIHHNGQFLPSEKTYEFTNEQAQLELEQMLRTMIQQQENGTTMGGGLGDGFGGNAAGSNSTNNNSNSNSNGSHSNPTYFTLLARVPEFPSSVDISGQSQLNGSTMLHNSVLLGYRAGVDILVEEGIELDIEDDSGLTALDYAIHTNNVEITSALLYAGSIVSYERLDRLPLRPTAAMTALLKEICGVDLSTVASSTAQDVTVPQVETEVEGLSAVEGSQQGDDGVPEDMGATDSIEDVHVETFTIPTSAAATTTVSGINTNATATASTTTITTTTTLTPPETATHRVISEAIAEEVEPVEENDDAIAPTSSFSDSSPPPADPTVSPSFDSSAPVLSSSKSNLFAISTIKSSSFRSILPDRRNRPSSLASVSTRSTGMISHAGTMSTMAPSATSSMQSRSTMLSGMSGSSSMGTGGRLMNSTKAGGLENVWQCAKKGNLSLVKYHLDKEPGLINTPWKFDGRSILSSACASSQPYELIEYLVNQRGAQVHCADSFYKRTPLHVLCEEGGLLNTQDDTWRLLMMNVISAQELEANERDVLQAMRFLLDRGAQVDAKNHWKETSLMRLMAGRDCLLMVQELYSRGADTRVKSSKDVYPHGTALAYAAFFGRIKSLQWMLENDLFINDEQNIKDAIRWASKALKNDSPSSSSSSSSLSAQHQQELQHATAAQTASVAKRKEERKQMVLRLLESWTGEAGQTKRKALAKAIVAEQADGWYRRISGIIGDDKPGSGDHHRDNNDDGDDDVIRMPYEMKPLWKEVSNIAETLASSPDHVSSPSSRKWNMRTILRKNT
ncbi:hypothetical protein BX616_010802 [Lobosporangium transversale]|nr:hypothetical protein BX616_010802 [Lobosporangium transversale]